METWRHICLFQKQSTSYFIKGNFLNIHRRIHDETNHNETNHYETNHQEPGFAAVFNC